MKSLSTVIKESMISEDSDDITNKLNAQQKSDKQAIEKALKCKVTRVRSGEVSKNYTFTYYSTDMQYTDETKDLSSKTKLGKQIYNDVINATGIERDIYNDVWVTSARNDGKSIVFIGIKREIAK